MWDKNPQIWPYFQLYHSVMAPSNGIKTYQICCWSVNRMSTGTHKNCKNGQICSFSPHRGDSINQSRWNLAWKCTTSPPSHANLAWSVREMGTEAPNVENCVKYHNISADFCTARVAIYNSLLPFLCPILPLPSLPLPKNYNLGCGHPDSFAATQRYLLYLVKLKQSRFKWVEDEQMCNTKNLRCHYIH